MTYKNNNFYQKYNIFSPLDQFGIDDNCGFMIDNKKVWETVGFLVDFLDLTLVSNITSIEYITVLCMLGSISLLVDDESPVEAQWEEGSLTISTIQANVLGMNLIGLIPGAETLTSSLSVTFILIFCVISVVTLLGIALHGFRFIATLLPQGTPVLMAPFIIFIESISYLARAFSLGIRLFANMFAGHSLVKILMSFAWTFAMSSTFFVSIPVLILILAVLAL